MGAGRKRCDNRGFTLIELVVAMAISGVVALLVGTLMYNASKWFSSESAKATIQNELQEVSEQLDDTLMEAMALSIEKDGEVTYIYTGERNDDGTWKEVNDSNRVIIVKNNKIWIRTEKPANVDAQSEGYLITDKIKDFSIQVNQVTERVDVSAGTNGYTTNPMSVRVKLTLELNKRQAVLDKDIRMRNKFSAFTLKDGGIEKKYAVVSKKKAKEWESTTVATP